MEAESNVANEGELTKEKDLSLEDFIENIRLLEIKKLEKKLRKKGLGLTAEDIIDVDIAHAIRRAVVNLQEEVKQIKESKAKRLVEGSARSRHANLQKQNGIVDIVQILPDKNLQDRVDEELKKEFNGSDLPEQIWRGWSNSICTFISIYKGETNGYLMLPVMTQEIDEQDDFKIPMLAEDLNDLTKAKKQIDDFITDISNKLDKYSFLIIRGLRRKINNNSPSDAERIELFEAHQIIEDTRDRTVSNLRKIQNFISAGEAIAQKLRGRKPNNAAKRMGLNVYAWLEYSRKANKLQFAINDDEDGYFVRYLRIISRLLIDYCECKDDELPFNPRHVAHDTLKNYQDQ